MSARSQYHAPNCSKARKAAKTIGRHARRLQRREARKLNGDFSAQLRALPAFCSADVSVTGDPPRFGVDKTLKRLYIRTQEAHRTRSCTW